MANMKDGGDGSVFTTKGGRGGLLTRGGRKGVLESEEMGCAKIGVAFPDCPFFRNPTLRVTGEH